MTIDERLDALTMSLELEHREGQAQRERIEEQGRNIAQLRDLIEIDSQNIRSLARIAEIHERRIEQLEG